MKRGLLDPKFRYVPASRTNVAATFARIRREMKEAEDAKQQQEPKVRSIRAPARKGTP